MASVCPALAPIDKPKKAQPVPPEQYEHLKLYVLYNVEFNFLWTSTKPKAHGSVLIGEL